MLSVLESVRPQLKSRVIIHLAIADGDYCGHVLVRDTDHDGHIYERTYKLADAAVPGVVNKHRIYYMLPVLKDRPQDRPRRIVVSMRPNGNHACNCVHGRKATSCVHTQVLGELLRQGSL